MSRLAFIDERSGRLFVSSYSTTAAGVFVQGDWAEAADSSCEDASLGRLVRAALAASQSGVAHPDYRKGPAPERLRLLRLAGAKSETQYATGTREVSVESNDSPTVLITPHRNGGRRTGFTEMLDEVIEVDAKADDAALGRAVRRALEIATDGT